MSAHVIIIAEAGVNHNGDLEMAKQLVDAAAEAGADYVKFQTFRADKIVSKTAEKAIYQARNTESGGSQFDMLKKLEMPHDWHFILKDYAKQKGISFLSTGFDEDSIDFLQELGCDLFKIPSGEITNKPFLRHIAAKGKPVILSTGMCIMEDITAAMDVLISEGVSKRMITVLHCNTEYPTPMTDVNLLAMNVIRDTLGVNVGYSDHTLGIEVPVAAVALGASVIEKHFTLDKNLPGPDHRASLEPLELKAMVTAIRNTEQAISGTGVKEPSIAELANRLVARKSIHLKHPLEAGHILRSEDLEMKRPGDGISPMNMEQVIGRSIRYALPLEHKLSLNDLE
jgi:N,N'-diacetyllegionaminate synthase